MNDRLFEFAIADLDGKLVNQFGKTNANRQFLGLDEVDCQCCGWKDTYIYVLTESKEQALNLINANEDWLCGRCMCNLLADDSNGFVISKE